VTLILVVGAAAWELSSGGTGGRAVDASVRVTTTLAPTTSTLPPTTTTTVDPGRLPQTMERPSATSPALQTRVKALWNAIVADDPAPAMAFFFPLSAYEQVKAISDPDGDWHNRLVANYRQDIHALHVQLGAGAARAQLVGIEVPDAAQWILPGAEFNKGSYWRVYGTVLRYSLDNTSATLPVTSMISWRGEWYVVHLGAIR
jgi:hypothetical protein